VLFGHQSVGANIVQGLHEAIDRRVAGWPCEIADARMSSAGFFAHGRMGHNTDPRSKTEEFCRTVRGELGGRLDVALHKYCYVDVDASTDVRALFESYRRAMAELRRDRPAVTLVHVTVPLVRIDTGARRWLRSVTGSVSPHVANNASRERFNDLLRRHYCDHEPLFDLAALESAAPHDRSLRADYTDDGGHLNSRGRQHLATALLALLSSVAAAS
jgi:hypothetical protein